MNLTRLSSLSAAECVGTVQEPGPAAAPARLPNSDALQHASGQRFHHQTRSHGDHRIQAQAALKPVWIKRGNKKQNKNKTSLDSLDQVRHPCWATDWQQGRVSPSCQAEPQTVQLGDEGSIVTGLTAQQGADDSCYCWVWEQWKAAWSCSSCWENWDRSDAAGSLFVSALQITCSSAL